MAQPGWREGNFYILQNNCKYLPLEFLADWGDSVGFSCELMVIARALLHFRAFCQSLASTGHCIHPDTRYSCSCAVVSKSHAGLCAQGSSERFCGFVRTFSRNSGSSGFVQSRLPRLRSYSAPLWKLWVLVSGKFFILPNPDRPFRIAIWSSAAGHCSATLLSQFPRCLCCILNLHNGWTSCRIGQCHKYGYLCASWGSETLRYYCASCGINSMWHLRSWHIGVIG